MAEQDLESAVKGMAQGFAGKLKEIAGELMEDQALAEEGIVQQLDGERRRAGGEPEIRQASDDADDSETEPTDA